MFVYKDEAIEWILEQERQKKYFDNLDKNDEIQNEINLESSMEESSKLSLALSNRRKHKPINPLNLSERDLALKLAMDLLKK